MSPIAQMTILLSIIGGLLSALMLFLPEQYRTIAKQLPRHEWASKVLASITMIWTLIVLYHMNFRSWSWMRTYLVDHIPALASSDWGAVEFLKDPVMLLGILVYFLIIHFMKELLSIRAIGGLLLLAPSPILRAARWLDTPLRFVIIITAYTMIVLGMIYVLKPYKFRQWNEKYLPTDTSCRRWGIAGLLFSCILGIIAILAY